MKAVIFAGGKGTRISEYTNEIPKPLLRVGNEPILGHIINHYHTFGVRSFVVPVGHLYGHVIDYFSSICDFQASIPEKGKHFIYDGYTVDVIYTGENNQTGNCLYNLKEFLEYPFFLTYGDGLSNVNIYDSFIQWSRADSEIQITAVHPVPRFGQMELEGKTIKSFSEKAQGKDWINGGYMIVHPKVLDLLSGDYNENFEKDIIPKIALRGKAEAFFHEGYWHCIDTVRDLKKANEDWEKGAEWLKISGKIRKF